MKAVVIARRGSPVTPNVEFVTDRPKPAPGPGEVLVRTEASALNHLDLWVGMGLPGIKTEYPFVGGSDGAGRVDAVGAGVDAGWIGKRIVLNAAVLQPQGRTPGDEPAGEDLRMIGEHDQGTHAEYFTAPVTNLLDIGGTDPVVAASAGLTFLTAWRMLRTSAGLEPGQWVLIPGIGGGVALAALAICRHFACKTIVTSRSAEKLERAKALGACHGILDSGADFSGEVRTLTGRRGVDIVADSVGKAIHLGCLKSLCRGGTLVTCGCTSGADATTDLARIFWNQLRVAGSTMGSMDEFRAVMSLVSAGALAPVIDSRHAAPEARAAFDRLESGHQFGKIAFRWV